MSASAPAAGRAAGRGATVLAIVAVGLATAAAAAVGHPAAAAAPVLLATALWAACSAPLRAPAAILGFLVLALDDSGNADGLWHTPLAPLGDVLRLSLRTVFPGFGLPPLSVMEVALAVLLGLAAWRRSRGADEPAVATPAAVRAVVLGSVAALAVASGGGVARGGSAVVAVWQTRPLLLVAIWFLVLAAALRGRADPTLAARIVVVAALCAGAPRRVGAVRGRAGRRARRVRDEPRRLDALLHRGLVVLAHLVERRDARGLATAAAVLPVLLVGIRRTGGGRHGWSSRSARPRSSSSRAAAALAAAGGPGARRRAAAPRALRGGRVELARAAFRPVQVVRSIVDARVDRSTWDRKVENWNLAMSMRDHPVAGRGFGHEWTEYMASDDIAAIFERYRAQPHNQLLGLLLFGGAALFAAIWAPLVVLVLRRRAQLPARAIPEQRAAALWVAASAVVVAVQCFGDLGPFWPQYAVLTGMALAVGGNVAAATGALP